MYGGKIQEIAEINELFANPVNPYTQALMDSIPKLEMKERRLNSLKGINDWVLKNDTKYFSIILTIIN